MTSLPKDFFSSSSKKADLSVIHVMYYCRYAKNLNSNLPELREVSHDHL